MSKNWFLKFSLLIISLLLIISCSEYEKVLKSSDYELKYRKAVEFYNNKDYSRAISLFEQVVNVFRASTKGDSLVYYYAKSCYGDEDYIMAGHYFKEIVENYSRSPFAEESDYMSAYCYYLLSPRPTLDQEYTKTAIQALLKFDYNRPDSKYVPECKRLIAELNNKLAEKEYLGATLYYNMGDYSPIYYKAAIVAIKNCMNDYPNSKFREDLMFMSLKSNYIFAEKSVTARQKERYQSTLDEYYSFVGEFPKSEKYGKEVEKIYNHTKEVLGLQN